MAGRRHLLAAREAKPNGFIKLFENTTIHKQKKTYLGTGLAFARITQMSQTQQSTSSSG